MVHNDQAKALGLAHVSVDDIKKFNKDAKLIKKWARGYDILIVTDTLSRTVTKMIGRYVTSIGKLPVPIGENENLEAKIEELHRTIRFRVKKFPWLAQSVGIDTLSEDELRQNVTKSLNFLASLLPKGWQNIKAVTIKLKVIGKEEASKLQQEQQGEESKEKTKKE